MVTDGITATTYSEYPLKNWTPLQPNYDLQSDIDALWVEGIGHIAQYHCYWDMLYSHGVIYFLRDSLFREIESKLASETPPQDVRSHITRLNTLNSKIQLYEQQCQRTQLTGPTTPKPTKATQNPSGPQPLEPSRCR